MSEAVPVEREGGPSTEPEKRPAGKRKLVLMAVPAGLAFLLAGLWFAGPLPRGLGLTVASADKAPKAPEPIYVDLPEMVTNLNGSARRPSYVKLVARIEVAGPEDAERVRQSMPRLQDLFQTYLREMRPEELRGSAGTYRLREELIARADVAAAPTRVTDVLFIQMLIQ